MVKTKKNIQRKKTATSEKKSWFWLIAVLFAIILLPLAIWARNSLLNYQKSVHRADKKEKELAVTKLPSEIKKRLEQNPTATVRVPILIYHYVEFVQDKRDTIRQSLNILPPIFEQQLQTLQEANYTFITPSQLGEYLNGKKSLPDRPVIISFDDGYRDFYTDVLPILKRNNVKAVAYIVPGKLDQINYMFKWQVMDLLNSGLVEIGAHTMRHLNLKGAPKVLADYEIIQSKKVLEDMLYIPIVSFAYPYGAFDQQAIDIVKEAGFTTAVSTVGGNEVSQQNRFFLYRIHPGAATGKGLLQIIERKW